MNTMKNLIFSMHDAPAGHPLEIMKKLGISYYCATPQSLHDSWWFWCCKNAPNDLPEYLSELKGEPAKYIGYGINKELAKQIQELCQGSLLSQ